mgnify:CR=1 FL=1
MTLLAFLTLLAPMTAFAGSAHVVNGGETNPYVIAGGKGIAKLYLNRDTGSEEAALSVLVLKPGAEVPEHAHESSAELLFVVEGSVELVIDGKPYRAQKEDAIYIPSGIRHSARVPGVGKLVKVVQVYVGPGPEQRFKAPAGGAK